MLEQPIIAIERSAPLQSCTLSMKDLAFLYRLLQKKVDEAAEIQVRDWAKGEGDNSFENHVKNVKETFKIVVTIEGENGERQIEVSEGIFSSQNLPSRIVSVYFNSGTLYRATFNGQNPNNWLSILIDFTKPPQLDFTNPASNPTPNDSIITIYGNNDTWVNAVHQKTKEFFDGKKNGWVRESLHKRNFYDILVVFVGIPFSFVVIYNISFILDAISQHKIINFALYLYFFIFSLNIYRIFFSYTKWVWPKVELESQRSALTTHRRFWGGLMISLLAAAIYGLFFN